MRPLSEMTTGKVELTVKGYQAVLISGGCPGMA
jgi:hypothetical protein